MVLGFSRDVGAAERVRGVNRASLRWNRSWYYSMLVSVKRVSSLIPEAKQTIPEEGDRSHCTLCDIALHISLHIAFLRCALLVQAEDLPTPAIYGKTWEAIRDPYPPLIDHCEYGCVGDGHREFPAHPR
jgi:hypothetical protein